MQYRPEIDGLRAVAVLPVIGFHAGWAALGGGFVGVDVFFVISGYLITTIILGQIATNRFSVVGFYERRARRIIPALAVVVAACIPLAWLWLPPTSMVSFSHSLMAVAGFVSNLLFWQETSYFGAAAELKPLMHTWSLAIEEQFYLLIPLFMVLVSRWGMRGLWLLLGGLAILSFALSVWGTSVRPVATFYLLPTRGWELLVGALVALGTHPTASSGAVGHWQTGRLAQVGSLVGFALVVSAISMFDRTTPFPGYHALIPTIGTALILLCATTDTWVGRLLSSRLLVGIGVISYSAYLWHHPLFAFARHLTLTEPGPAVFGALIVATFTLAALSWRFVEQPFRRGVLSRRALFGAVIGVTVVVAGVGAYGNATHGHGIGRHQKAAAVVEMESRLEFNSGLGKECDQLMHLDVPCRTADAAKVLVWGDSYAMHLIQGLMASTSDPSLVQRAAAMCGPIFGLAPVTQMFPQGWAENCIARNDEVLALIQSPGGPRHVVLSSLFEQYLGPDARVLVRDGRLVQDDELVFAHFESTLRVLRESGVGVVVFAPPPRVRMDVGACLIKARWFNLGLDACDFALDDANRTQRRILEWLRRVERGGTRVVYLGAALCPEGTCRASVGDTLMFVDGGHLSAEGSAAIGRAMGFYELATSSR